MTRDCSENGFALLDALIALAIFGVITGMFVQAVNSSAMASRHAAASRQAILIAQSRLALAQELDELSQSGREAKFTWRAQIGRYAAEDGPGVEKVTVVVSDTVTGRPVTSLTSLRLAR
jgi:Tfp pilus assembly protein PilV